MNSHKNARLTMQGRKLLIERIAIMGLIAAAEAAGISRQSAGKWLRRFQEGGQQALRDRSSRPQRTRDSIDEDLAERIERLRRARMPMRRIASVVGRSVATVSRSLAGLGLSSLKALDPVEPIVRYERQAPGELLHMDTKKLGRIVRPWLPSFLSYYNARRPHSALGYKPPASRLGGNNLLQLNN